MFQSANAGGNGLPRIIGGADLMVHKVAPNKERDEWLAELEQVTNLVLGGAANETG